MTVRFFRRRFIEACIPVEAGETPLLRSFELTVGLEAPVNPLSGMTVNLTKVDQWMSELPKAALLSSEFRALEDFQAQMRDRIQTEDVVFLSIELKEDRRWWALTERGPEIGERRAIRKGSQDGQSLPMWQETIQTPGGVLLERREISMDGRTAQVYFPEL